MLQALLHHNSCVKFASIPLSPSLQSGQQHPGSVVRKPRSSTGEKADDNAHLLKFSFGKHFQDPRSRTCLILVFEHFNVIEITQANKLNFHSIKFDRL